MAIDVRQWWRRHQLERGVPVSDTLRTAPEDTNTTRALEETSLSRSK